MEIAHFVHEEYRKNAKFDLWKYQIKIQMNYDNDDIIWFFRDAIELQWQKDLFMHNLTVMNGFLRISEYDEAQFVQLNKKKIF